MSADRHPDTLGTAQHSAACGEQHAQVAQVGDREPRPLNGDGRRSRGPVPRLRSFYAALRLKTEVDPLALITFLVGLVPGSIAVWNWLTPASIEIVHPYAVTFKAEEQLIAGKPVDILRIAASFAFRNPHTTKRAEIRAVSAVVQVGSKVAEFEAGSYIHSYRDETDNKKLRINPIGDFGPISVPPDSSTESKEVYFYAKPAGEPDRFKYAFTIDDFRSRVDAGEPISVKFTIVSDRETFTIPFIPKLPKDLAARLAAPYKWDVQVDRSK
jgi:hypothetical protein